jgi:hypothetical protein
MFSRDVTIQPPFHGQKNWFPSIKHGRNGTLIEDFGNSMTAVQANQPHSQPDSIAFRKHHPKSRRSAFSPPKIHRSIPSNLHHDSL